MPISDAGAGLSMLPAVAAVDAVAASTCGAVRPGIKWVNDLVIGHQKIGGVLTGAHVTGRRFDDVLWGIGLNVAVLPHVEPTPFVPAATCLHAVPGGEQVSLSRLYWALLAAIETRFRQLLDDGVCSLFRHYRDASLVVGRSVAVWDEADCRDADPYQWGPPLAEGVVTGIRDDLTLTLDGGRDVIARGRLAMRDHG
jgi:biotin-(acetyl-CoA carboxylase) ligase